VSGRAGTLAPEGAGGGGKRGALVQPAMTNTTAIIRLGVTREKTVMVLLLLEALGALLILVFIVWWTMFSGRNKGELKDDVRRETDPDKPGDSL
jgi:hypothetical protein